MGKSRSSICLPAGRNDHWLGRSTEPSACSPGNCERTGPAVAGEAGRELKGQVPGVNPASNMRAAETQTTRRIDGVLTTDPQTSALPPPAAQWIPPA